MWLRFRVMCLGGGISNGYLGTTMADTGVAYIPMLSFSWRDGSYLLYKGIHVVDKLTKMW